MDTSLKMDFFKSLERHPVRQDFRSQTFFSNRSRGISGRRLLRKRRPLLVSEEVVVGPGNLA